MRSSTGTERRQEKRWVAPPRGKEARLYRLSDLAWLLGTVVVCLFLLESEGLLTWAQRMEVSAAQAGAVSMLRTANDLLQSVGLTRPREAAVRMGDGLAQWLGAEADPLLAGGWRNPTPSSDSSPERTQVDIAPEKESQLEPSDDEALPSEPTAETGPTGATLLLLGDSMMAGSLGSAIALNLAREPKPHLVRAVQTATGLSRPDVFDWLKVLPPLLEREKPALVICSLGANDATNIRPGDRVIEFGHAGWRSAYAERVRAMMRALTARGARVLWLGLPPMRNASFSERARHLNVIFAQAAREVPGVEYLDVEVLVARDGEYVTFIRNSEGRFVRVRMEDGVHYAPAGAKLISRWLVDWIYERSSLVGAAR